MRLKEQLKSKTTILLILSVVLAVMIAAGGTMAYFSGSDSVKNTLTIGKMTLDLDEPKWEPGNGSDLKPGNVAEKDPTVTAKDGDGYMRVCMEIVDGNGTAITDTERIDMILATLWYDKTDSISVDEKYSTDGLTALEAAGKVDREYNKTDFKFAGTDAKNPGTRYYNYIGGDGIFRASKNDEATLFTNVVIPYNWTNPNICILSGDDYTVDKESGRTEIITKGPGYKIILSAQAIQSTGMDSAADAFNQLDSVTNVTRDVSSVL